MASFHNSFAHSY